MKKVLIVGLVLLAGISFAADVESVNTRQGYTTLYEVRDQLNNLAEGGTLTNGLTVTGETTTDGKYAAVGPDATTGLMIVTGTGTNGQTTVTFGTTFNAAPKVCLSWTDDISGASAVTNGALSATSITSSNFVPKTAAAIGVAVTNFNYIAIGARP